MFRRWLGIFSSPKACIYNVCVKIKREVPFSRFFSFKNKQKFRLSKKFHFLCLLPIFPATPSWALLQPNIHLLLTDLPKKPHPPAPFHEFIDTHPSTLICFTDRTGYAFFIGDHTFTYCRQNFLSVFTIGFQAIYYCLTNISADPKPQQRPCANQTYPYIVALF